MKIAIVSTSLIRRSACLRDDPSGRAPDPQHHRLDAAYYLGDTEERELAAAVQNLRRAIARYRNAHRRYKESRERLKAMRSSGEMIIIDNSE